MYHSSCGVISVLASRLWHDENTRGRGEPNRKQNAVINKIWINSCKFESKPSSNYPWLPEVFLTRFLRRCLSCRSCRVPSVAETNRFIPTKRSREKKKPLEPSVASNFSWVHFLNSQNCTPISPIDLNVKNYSHLLSLCNTTLPDGLKQVALLFHPACSPTNHTVSHTDFPVFPFPSATCVYF